MVLVKYKGRNYDINAYSAVEYDRGGDPEYNDFVDICYTDYQAILEALHPEYKWYHGRDNDYQGEWWSAGVDKDGNWAVQEGSFGSCSGCDQLQGVETEQAALSLLKDIDLITPVVGVDIITYLKQSDNNAMWGGSQAIHELMANICKGEGWTGLTE